MAIPGTRRLWLVGAGNMGGAMLARWVASGVVAPTNITVIDPGSPALPAGVRHVASLPEDEGADILVLAIKPQQLGAVVPTLARAKPALLVSILAGVECATLAAAVPAGTVVRAMPNLAVSIGQGVVALHSDATDASARGAAEALMAPLGLVEWIDDESLFHAVTALSGSGPGFVYRFIDALAAAGAALGIPPEQAGRLALATVEGAAVLAAQSDADPATLADRVASPGGMTREGLNVLDADDAILRLLTDTLTATTRRGKELAAAARR